MENITSFLSHVDWAVVVATLLGPILAVQAQKTIEGLREKRFRKTALFEQLMATRRARVSPEHVRALNMIDLVFYGQRRFGRETRSAREQKVLDCWKEYLDHLNNRSDEQPVTQWASAGDELFTNLLHAIAQDIGFVFDRVQLKRGAYTPIAHSEIEEEQTQFRKAALSLVSGNHALKMNVVGFPSDQGAVATHRAAIERLSRALESGALHVEIVNDERPAPTA